MKRQLLILGNGFDLACGLDSNYESFFNWRLGNLMEYVDKEMILETEHTGDTKAGATFTKWGTINNHEKYCVNDLNALVNKDDIKDNNSYESYTIWDLFF
ncbi:hypothetical protein [Liquorilactobacillus uvarum]|nr:hypothetical protein [Liquorilactobacillus uvarum]